MTTVRYVCPIQILLHVHTVEVEGSLRDKASLALILSAFSTSLAIWAAAKEVKYHCLLNYVAHQTKLKIIQIIIRCKCFFFFTGREPTTWLANNCLQIMVCSCAMSFNCFWLQILFCSCVNETMLSPSCDRSCMKMADRFASRRYSLKNKLSDRMIKQLLNSVIAKYRDLSVSRRSITPPRLQEIIDLLATDKSRYSAQPRPMLII